MGTGRGVGRMRGAGMLSRPRRWSVARQLLALQAAVVVLLVAVGAALAYLDARRAVGDRARQEVAAVAATIADAPNVRAALAGGGAPSRELQPYAERVRADTGVDFITIMSPDGIRYTHPVPGRIGERFLGNTGRARLGRPLTETYTGTLGPSVRTVAPVFADPSAPSGGSGTSGSVGGSGGRRVVALVAVGITVSSISAELRERLVSLVAVAVAVLAAGMAGSYLVSARLRRQTRGVAPGELREMFEYYEAILHAVREGLILLDRDGRVALCNDAARELLGLAGDPRGRSAAELGLSGELAAALASAEPRSDEIHVGDTRVLVVNASPVRSRDRAMGNVVTLRDHTELQGLAGELDTVRGFAESLRAQAHEAANRLHTVVSLVELDRPDDAVAFATAELETAQRLTDRVVGAVAEPVLAALLLGKTTEAGERGVELTVTADTAFDAAPVPDKASVASGASGVSEALGGIEARDLVTILGNLIDNAVDAAAEGAAERPPRVAVTVRVDGGELLVRVADSGAGVDPEAVPELFRRGWTTKAADGPVGHGLGLALVGQAVRRNGGRIEVAREDGAVFTVRLPLDGGGA